MATYSLLGLNGPAAGLNMDTLGIGELARMAILLQSSTTDSRENPPPIGYPLEVLSAATISGTGLAYSALRLITGGSVSGLSITHYAPAGRAIINITGITGLPGATLQNAITQNDSGVVFSTALSGNDDGHGSVGADLMRGYDGADTLNGDAGSDTIFGGLGNDVIYGASAPGAGASETAFNYLRGDEGNDSISGAQGFDDANGNMGADTIHGNDGDDYSVGGKDDDVLFGDNGSDIVWGNLGADTCDGGDGNDQVRGGQGDDSVAGGAGDDFVSGDRGNDTISGGAGADLFHGSQDAGIDRVLDFRLSDGDRVFLDPGATYTTSQVGADTIIDMGGGNQMILVGVQLSSLPAGTIFLG